ncbi:MAG: hypothetical protein GXP63_02900 [DPANN group archaeon]|nr:hypothetical protein [DPANN group archaeon]
MERHASGGFLEKMISSLKRFYETKGKQVLWEIPLIRFIPFYMMERQQEKDWEKLNEYISFLDELSTPDLIRYQTSIGLLGKMVPVNRKKALDEFIAYTDKTVETDKMAIINEWIRIVDSHDDKPYLNILKSKIS